MWQIFCNAAAATLERTSTNMRDIGVLLFACLALSSPPVLAADPTPKHASQSRAECQAALDRVDDLVSTPVVDVSVNGESAAGLVEGLALCRSGRTEQGAVLVRRALKAIHPVQ
jgi:hypothetical protein